MCFVSYVGEWGQRTIPERYPNIFEPAVPATSSSTTWGINLNMVTAEEFAALKKEVEDLKALLRKAKVIDEVAGNPDCEMEEKVAFFKKLAEFLGVDMKDVFA